MTSTVSSIETANLIRRRLEARAAELYRPWTNAIRTTLLAALLAVIVGLDVGLLTRQPGLAAVAAILVSAIGGSVAWRWLLEPRHRAGLELVLDHNCHERWEWKQETGTDVPASAAAVRHWLEDHPTGDGRVSMLLRLGRLAEADAAIATLEPRTPEEAFSVEIHRKSREQFAGQRPDLAALHGSWRSLPDPRERRHRRECLAMLDAQIAVADGRDPWPLLAEARAEIGEVHRSVQMPWLAAKWAVLQLPVIALTVGLTFAFID